MLNSTDYNIQLKKGLEANLPEADLVQVGEPHFAYDTGALYISDGTDWWKFQGVKVVVPTLLIDDEDSLLIDDNYKLLI